MRFAMVALALAALSSGSSYAWDREPEAFWGLKLGAPLAAQLPECSRDPRHTRLYSLQQERRCYKVPEYSKRFVELAVNPPLGIGVADAQAWLLDGNIEGVRFKVAHYNWRKLESLLVERFGPPTKVETVQLTTRAGARLSGQDLVWAGANVFIELSEYADRITESVLWVTTSTMRAASEAEAKKNAQQHGGNL